MGDRNNRLAVLVNKHAINMKTRPVLCLGRPTYDDELKKIVHNMLLGTSI